MTYVLEDRKENERLEFQSQIAAYDFKEEFKGVLPHAGSRVLDAGCGGGLLTNYLFNVVKEIEIMGVDVSSPRIEQASKKYPHLKFESHDLSRLPFQEGSFDFIFSHYVYEHLKDPIAVTKELKRVLKKDGEILLINPDGVFENFFCEDRELVRDIERCCQYLASNVVDNRAGRKLVQYLREAGFEIEKVRVQTFLFEGEDLARERINYIERFKFLGPHMNELLGQKRAEEVRCQFLKLLEQEKCTLFQNNFIVKAKKL